MAREKVESKNSEGEDIVVYVQAPTPKDKREAKLYGNSLVARMVAKGDALLRSELLNALREKGKWSDKQQERLDEINGQIESKLLEIKGGGIKLVEARKLAIEVRNLRNATALMLMEYNELDRFTAESHGEDAEMDYLASVCIKDEEGRSVFKDVDDYILHSEEPYAAEAADKLASMVYNISDDWRAQLPENRFLKKYGFVNDSLELVNKDGKKVDAEGRVLDESYHYVNDNGDRVDIDGRLLDDDGLPKVEFHPFLDDDGQPLS